MTDKSDERPPDHDAEQGPAPRLPRSSFFGRVQVRDLTAIITLVIALLAVLGLRKGCAQGVGNMFRAFEPPIDAGRSSGVPPSAVPLAPREVQ